MNSWMNTRFAAGLGWTLVHSLWELGFLAILGALAMQALRRRSAEARYGAACAVLVLMMVCPAVTYMYVLPEAREKASASYTVTARTLNFKDGPSVRLEPASDPAHVTAAASQSESVAERVRDAVEPYLPYAVIAYIAGVLLLAGRLGVSYLRLKLLMQRAEPVSAAMQKTLRSLCKRMRITRAVRLVESGLVEVPTLMGAVRPVILMPAAALMGLSAEQLEALLAHELAHIRRHDYLVNLVQSVLETLLFYHPAVWWISKQIRQEREHCCDDAAMNITGDRVGYANALAAMEHRRAIPGGVLALSAGSGVLLPRIRRILKGNDTSGRNVPLTAVFCLILILGGAVYFGCSPQGERSAGSTTSLSVPGTTPAALASDQDIGITLETQFILVSDAFLDDFRVGWNLNIPVYHPENPTAPYSRGSASIIDDWTSNILHQATASDKRTVKFPSKSFDVLNGRPSTLDFAGTGPHVQLAFTPQLSADGKYVILTFHIADGSATQPTGELTPTTQTGFAVWRAPNGVASNESKEINTMVSVPASGTLLVGMPGPFTATAADGSLTKGQLLMLLKPGVSAMTTTTPAASREEHPSTDQPRLAVYDIRDWQVRNRQSTIRPPQLTGEILTVDRKVNGVDLNSFNKGTNSEQEQWNKIVSDLVQQIETTVATTSWKDKGTGQGTIREFNGQLIVSQTPDNQAAVRALIESLRAKLATRLTLETKIYLVNEETFTALNLPNPEAVTATQPNVANATIRVMNEEALPAIERKIGEAMGTLTIKAPRVTLFNGRRGYIANISQQNIVSAFHKVKDAEGKEGTNLDVKTLSTGVVVDVQVSVAEDQKTIELHAHPAMSQLDHIETITDPDSPPEVQGTLGVFYQKPFIRAAEIQGTARMASGSVMILTGATMTGDFKLPNGFDGAGWTSVGSEGFKGKRQLVVILRPTWNLQANQQTQSVSGAVTTPPGKADSVVKHLQLKNAHAADVARLINAMFSPVNAGDPATAPTRGNRVYADSDARTNTVIVAGPADQVKQALDMIQKIEETSEPVKAGP